MTLILCFGNPLRGDEAVGWRVAERLPGAEVGARVVACHALVPEFAPAIAAAERAHAGQLSTRTRKGQRAQRRPSAVSVRVMRATTHPVHFHASILPADPVCLATRGRKHASERAILDKTARGTGVAVTAGHELHSRQSQ